MAVCVCTDSWRDSLGFYWPQLYKALESISYKGYPQRECQDLCIDRDT